MEESMNTPEIASLVASLVSVIIGIIAIGLSIVFYKMSSEISENTKEAAKGIGSSVERLEKIFDKLYSDTFSMMRDTVTDMRKHIWPEEAKADDNISEEAQKKADEKVSIIKNDIDGEIAKILHKQSITDAKISSIRGLVERAITESRKVETEARKETVREHIIQKIKWYANRNIPCEAHFIVDKIFEQYAIPQGLIVTELYKMREEGILDWADKKLTTDTLIKLRENRGIKSMADLL